MSTDDPHGRLSRRGFFGSSAAAVAAAGGWQRRLAAEESEEASSKPYEVRGPSGLRLRRFGKTGRYVSVIAGNETLPTPVAQRALQLGVNYWHKAGEIGGTAARRPADLSEMLEKRNARKSVLIDFAHGNPLVEQDKDKLVAEFKEAMRRCGFDFVDFYKMHGGYTREDVAAFEDLKQQGLVGALAASLHDAPEIVKEIVDFESLDAIQIPINRPMVFWSDRRSGGRLRELCAYCKQKGVGVIGMKTLAGGPTRWQANHRLIARLKKFFPDTKSLAKAIIKDVLTIDGLSSLVVMCQTEQQLREAVDASGGQLADSERRGLDVFAAGMRSEFCQMCGRCQQACPQGVAVRDVLRAELHFAAYADRAGASQIYRAVPRYRRASACDGCEQCARACPNGIPIVRRIRQVGEWMA